MASSRTKPAESASTGHANRLYCLLVAAALVCLGDRLCDGVARCLPSINGEGNGAAAYHLQRVFLHTPSSPNDRPMRVFLVGSSIVRQNLDEGLLQDALSTVGFVHVENLAVDASFVLSSLVVMSRLRDLSPTIVVWGIPDSVLSGDETDELHRPWDTPINLELGSSVLYAYFPALPGRWRAASQDWLLDHWRLFRYRLFFRQYLVTLAKSKFTGDAGRFGPYRSLAARPDSRRLEAAIKYYLGKIDAEVPSPTAVARRHQLAGTAVTVADTLVRQAGGRLLVAWLPLATDSIRAPSPELSTMRAACARAEVPFVDLHGAVPISGFSDTHHANREGKRATTEALIPAVRALLRQTSASVPSHR